MNQVITPEKIQGSHQFTSLEKLKQELEKHNKKPEQLSKIQETIDEAIKNDTRKGIIEFSQSEWMTIIGEGKLATIEEVQSLLREKITNQKEVIDASQKERKGITKTLEEKARGIKKTLEGIKDKGSDIVKENLEKIKTITDMPPWKRWILGVGLSIGIGVTGFFGKIASFFGYKGIEKKTEMMRKTKEMMEAVTKDPEAALEKYGKSTLEQAKKATEGTVAGSPEENEENDVDKKPTNILEKVTIGILGTGAFMSLKKRLPGKMATGIEGHGPSLMDRIVRNRGLRLFGLTGMTVWGVSTVYKYLSSEENRAKIGTFPASISEQKKWWSDVANKSGIQEGKDKILAIISGEKLEEHLAEKEVEDGYVKLKDHPMFIGAINQLKIYEATLEEMIAKNKEGMEAFLTGVCLKFPGMSLAALKASAGSIGLAGALLKSFAAMGLLPASIAGVGLFALATNGKEAIANIQLPLHLTTADEITPYFLDTLGESDIMGSLGEYFPVEKITESAKKFGDWCENSGAKLSQEIEKACIFITEKIPEAFQNSLILTEKEKILSINLPGFESLQKSLLTLRAKEKDSGQTGFESQYIALIGNQGEKDGIVNQIIQKLTAKENINEGDIRTLMDASRGTDLRFFPEDGDEENGSIQWVQLDAEGAMKGLPENLCINPRSSWEEQLKATYNFQRKKNINGIFEVFTRKFRFLTSDAAEAYKGDPEKSQSELMNFFNTGGRLVGFGSSLYAEYFGQRYLLGPINIIRTILPNSLGGVTMQEGVTEYAGHVGTFMVICGVKYAAQKVGWYKSYGNNILLETAAAPFRGIKGVFKGGLHLYEMWKNGEIGEILKDPKIIIREPFYRFLSKLPILGGDVAGFGEITRLHTQKKALTRMIEALESADGWAKELRTEFNIGHFERNSLNKVNRILDELGKDTKYADYIAQLRTTIGVEAGASIAPGKLREILGILIAERGEINGQILELRGADNVRISNAWDDALRAAEHAEHQNSVGRIGHLKTKGKGIAAIIGLLGVGYLIDKMHDAKDDIKLRDIGKEVETFGFRKSEKIEEEKDEKTTAGTGLREYQVGIDELNKNYRNQDENIAHLFDRNWLKSKSQDEIKNVIEKICSAHEKNIKPMLGLIKNNRKDIQDFAKTNDLSEKAINTRLFNETHSPVLFSITEKQGEIVVEHMNEVDLSKALWNYADQIHTPEGKIAGGTATVGKIGLRVAPITGTLYSFYDAYEDFSRGHTVEGWKNIGWGVVSGVADVFTLGWAGTAGRAAKVGIAVTKGSVIGGASLTDLALTAKRSESIKISDL